MEDILDTGTVSLYLISEKLYSLLKKEQITGWQTFDVKIFDKTGNEVLGYYGFSIIGRCGKVDYNAGEIIEKRSIPTGPLGKFRKGLHVDLSKWDGSDIFRPEGSFFIITTKKSVEIIKNSCITNIEFDNLGDIELLQY